MHCIRLFMFNLRAVRIIDLIWPQKMYPKSRELNNSEYEINMNLKHRILCALKICLLWPSTYDILYVVPPPPVRILFYMLVLLHYCFFLLLVHLHVFFFIRYALRMQRTNVCRAVTGCYKTVRFSPSVH